MIIAWLVLFWLPGVYIEQFYIAFAFPTLGLAWLGLWVLDTVLASLNDDRTSNGGTR